ncbi:MAG: prepilin-type N-terminal cleavage/methylation domain-containing protein [Gammaproteobacteria bacterium]|nr:prepilin-type N-terminal cleavage/methylation domain-containing protein [Gammaproteobacteria bacterium]
MNMQTQTGVTLPELLTTILVGAILMTIGIPGMIDYLRNNRVTSAANRFVSSLNYARGEAINHGGASGYVSAIDDGDWGKGWKLYLWNDPPDVTTKELIREIYLDETTTTIKNLGVNLTGGEITFRGDGTFALSGNPTDFYVCGTDVMYGRHIQILPTGRVVRVTNEYTGC